MPDPALPQPWPKPLPGRVTYRRVYRDALGRPMKSGTATLTPKQGARVDEVTVPPVTVHVDIVGGVLHAELLPGTYVLSAAMKTVDGERASDRDEITLEAS